MSSANMTACLALLSLAARLLLAEQPVESAASTQVVVRSVTVTGTGLPVTLATQVGQPYNAALLSRDVRTLWNMGRFEDVRVKADGSAVTFYVVETRQFLLQKMLMEPSNLGVRLAVPEGTLLDRLRAQAIAREARKQLEADGYANAQVYPEFVPVSTSKADLRLTITPGDRTRVSEIQFVGVPVLDPAQLRQELRAMRIRHILGWRLLPAYSAEAVDADLARLRSLYLSQGYFEAKVRLDNTEIQSKNVSIAIRIDAGPRSHSTTRPCDLCAALLRERREAER